MPEVRDIHAGLHVVQVRTIERPRTVAEVQDLVRRCARDGLPIAICGGRHAMGGQQFLEDGLLMDLSGLDQVLKADSHAGIIDVEAGIQWPALMAWTAQHVPTWGIVQKQTGADRLSIGGALAANIHGRGLSMQPIIQDVESFTVIDPSGNSIHCSRTQNAELFSLAIGGYGLFGIIVTVRLRLMPRRRLRRHVVITTVDRLMEDMEARRAEGYLFGDFQFMTDEQSPLFMHEGVFSCYVPVEPKAPLSQPLSQPQRRLAQNDWRTLYRLAHMDRAELYRTYAAYYLATDGQQYESDDHQRSDYIDDYHQDLDSLLGHTTPHSEMISELYVPRAQLTAFMHAARDLLRRLHMPVIYGTIRLIEHDDISFLAWAWQPWACIIFNLCVAHNQPGMERAQIAFRDLIDCALTFSGSYYLTYHRWATAEQLLAAHPRIIEFLAHKAARDPNGIFQSDWYRYCKNLLK